MFEEWDMGGMLLPGPIRGSLRGERRGQGARNGGVESLGDSMLLVHQDLTEGWTRMLRGNPEFTTLMHSYMQQLLRLLGKFSKPRLLVAFCKSHHRRSASW